MPGRATEAARQPAVTRSVAPFNRPRAPAQRAVARLGGVRPDELGLTAKVERVKRADLRWLALVPIVPAVLLIFFGFIWTALPQLLIGAGLLALAAIIWVVFATDE